MSFIPHTTADIKTMLTYLGLNQLSDLLDEIPPELKTEVSKNLPGALNEYDLSTLMKERASNNFRGLSFLGAGAYEHVIPAAIWQIAMRGEWLTAYTPYQAEASQGSLQLLYEYQTMMANLMAMEVSNASLYDGGSALAEAILMALRIRKMEGATTQSHTILVPPGLHPQYLRVSKSLTLAHALTFKTLPMEDGVISPLNPNITDRPLALIIQQPNFFGQLEAVDALTDWAHEQQILVIGVVNPIAIALFKPPGEWGHKGADIVCGEGQPLGIPLSGGGPYFGFFCTRHEWVRQLPGRIVGRTTDTLGREGFVLTLQAREQHIRRAKATSNICTNQGLMVVAATLFMSLLGPQGLREMALKCYQNLHLLIKKLESIQLQPLFKGPRFHEVVISLPQTPQTVLAHLKQEGILGGYDLSQSLRSDKNPLLLCVTERKTEAELDRLVYCLGEVIR